MLKNQEEVHRVLKLLTDYQHCSSLKIYIHKPMFVQLGYKSLVVDPSVVLSFTIEFRYLGITFCSTKIETEYKNFRHHLDKMNILLQIWHLCDFCLRGKIIILKSLAMSQIFIL